MTTHEKVRALVEHVQTLDARTVAPEFADVIQGAQILRGLGIKIPSPLEFLLPADPAEADLLVDKLIGLLLELRGDDLPPFDPDQYGESIVAEFLRAAGEGAS